MSGPVILLIDEEPEEVDYLFDGIRKQCVVEVLEDATTALRTLAAIARGERRCDVIILDVMVPVVDPLSGEDFPADFVETSVDSGLKLLEALRDREGYVIPASIPVMLHTIRSDPSVKEAASRHGAEYFQKAPSEHRRTKVFLDAALGVTRRPDG